MGYTPTKGSPRPPTPGPNIIEAGLQAAENLAAKIPASQGLQNEIDLVLTSIGAAVAAIDPDGLKGEEREAVIDANYAMAQSSDAATKAAGIAGLTAFATDVPAHPTSWVRDARWCCVDVGAPDPLPGGP